MVSKAILTFAMAAGAAQGASLAKRDSGTLFATEATIYDVGVGSATCSRDGVVQIFKSDIDQGRDKTALLTFDIPESLAGHKCKLGFTLGNGWSDGQSDNLQLFTSLEASPACSIPDGYIASYPPGNWRGINIGDIAIGVPTSTITPYGDSLLKGGDCPAGQTLAYELVGQGQDVWVGLSTKEEGLYIEYS